MLYKDTYILNGKSYKTNCVPVPRSAPRGSLWGLFSSRWSVAPLFSVISYHMLFPNNRMATGPHTPEPHSYWKPFPASPSREMPGTAAGKMTRWPSRRSPGSGRKTISRTRWALPASRTWGWKCGVPAGLEPSCGRSPEPVSPVAQGRCYLCRSLLHTSEPSPWPDLKI